ncbi:MAG: alanine racemase [Methylococcales bacterium]|nr:alanine racemase [Methylococcales bacterium]
MADTVPSVYVQLDYQALKHNARRLRQQAPDAKLLAVVKADAYGHGMTESAKALADEVDAFAVARVEEGVALRETGCRRRIVVLAGFANAEQLRECQSFKLEAVLHCPEQVHWLAAHGGEQPLPVWIKLDTGMNRLGFRPEQLSEVYAQLRTLSRIARPIHLMTHLACADDPTDAMTQRQLACFARARAQVAGECCIANSAAVLTWPDAYSDWLRPGLMLYGISPFPGQTGLELGLKPVMRLLARIIAIKPVYPGETVGYGGIWRCQKATRMAVVGIGYGDGYPREIAAHTPVWVAGRQVPIIGRVSMDMLTVDVSDCADARVGSEVVLWGGELPVERIAEAAGTIPYTLVCGLTRRVKRRG